MVWPHRSCFSFAFGCLGSYFLLCNNRAAFHNNLMAQRMNLSTDENIFVLSCQISYTSIYLIISLSIRICYGKPVISKIKLWTAPVLIWWTNDNYTVSTIDAMKWNVWGLRRFSQKYEMGYEPLKKAFISIVDKLYIPVGKNMLRPQITLTRTAETRILCCRKTLDSPNRHTKGQAWEKLASIDHS